MEEAEQLCDRVAIFDQGKVISEGTPRELIASIGAEHVIEFSVDETNERFDLEQLRELDTVDRLEGTSDDHFRMTLGKPHIVLPKLITLTRRLGNQSNKLGHTPRKPRRCFY